MSETGKPLHWVVQYCSSVRPYKGPFTWSDCVSWIAIDKFKTKTEADAFLEEERKKRKHSFVGAALRVYPIYPSVTLNKYRSLVTEDTFVKGVDPEAFVQRLLAKKVNLVVDVRRSFYRSPPYYPKAFEEMLKPYGIRYVYEKRFGNPYKITEVPDLSENKRLYQKYVLTEQKDLLEKWKTLVKEHPEENVALVCWCPTNDPEKCHRFWLAELLKAEGETLASRKWRLRVKAERLLKEIREEKARIGV